MIDYMTFREAARGGTERERLTDALIDYALDHIDNYSLVEIYEALAMATASVRQLKDHGSYIVDFK